MAKFTVTYSITSFAGQDGEVEETGFICENASLRAAIEDVTGTRTSRVSGVECVECDSYPCDHPRWITVYNGTEYETGAVENRSLHIPHYVSAASARRIARLLGAYGVVS